MSSKQKICVLLRLGRKSGKMSDKNVYVLVGTFCSVHSVLFFLFCKPFNKQFQITFWLNMNSNNTGSTSDLKNPLLQKKKHLCATGPENLPKLEYFRKFLNRFQKTRSEMKTYHFIFVYVVNNQFYSKIWIFRKNFFFTSTFF